MSLLHAMQAKRAEYEAKLAPQQPAARADASAPRQQRRATIVVTTKLEPASDPTATDTLLGQSPATMSAADIVQLQEMAKNLKVARDGPLAAASVASPGAVASPDAAMLATEHPMPQSALADAKAQPTADATAKLPGANAESDEADLFHDKAERKRKWSQFMSTLQDTQQVRRCRVEKCPSELRPSIANVSEQTYWFPIWCRNGGKWSGIDYSESMRKRDTESEIEEKEWCTKGQYEKIMGDRDVVKAICDSLEGNPHRCRPHPDVPWMESARQYFVRTSFFRFHL